MPLFIVKFTLTVVFFMLSGFPLLANAISTSESYVILADSLNCGGLYSTSTAYTITDTACETAGSNDSQGVYSTSTSYTVGSGFQTVEDKPFISVSLSGGSIAFGTISQDAVASSTITSTVSTNASYGYQSTILSDGDFRTNKGKNATNASDSDSITANSGKYGFGTSGSSGLYNSADTGISSSTPKAYARKTSAASSDATTIRLKFAPSNLTPSGDYSQQITLITTATF
jgi:hypothetical protein